MQLLVAPRGVCVGNSNGLLAPPLAAPNLPRRRPRCGHGATPRGAAAT